ncbi:MAG: TolC family protein [Phenylobacterium sp.]|uniref:TolC family protein n=1 Tax=Phenylobacterium sp. TaxID=1871053 RepID=UPI00271EBAA9|nr:TolC family protein [Phenylobacterium sp.]MDO8410953.1 TolC family protein [Phenylobacterium sp.]
MFTHNRRPLLAAASGLVALGLSAGVGVAEPAPAFTDLLRQAQETAPRLAEARADIARAEGLAQQAGVRPNPTVGLEIENFSGSGPYSGISQAETTASISQTLELGGKRSARVSAAQGEVEAARQRAQRAQVDFRFDLAVAYAEAEASDRRLVLAQEALGLAEEDARIARAFVEQGREPELRRIQAEAAVQAARATVEEAQAAGATAFANLTALSGSAAPITSIPVSLLDGTPPRSAISPVASTAPGYLVAQAEREAARRRLALERRRAVPDVNVSVGFRRFENSDASAFIAGVSVPLPLFDRNRGNVRAVQAEVTAAEARLNAARFDAEATVRASTARAAAAETRLAAAREGERAAQEAYRLTRIGYEGGKLSLAELLVARRALTDARGQTIAAASERVSAQAALARMSGVAGSGDSQ